MQVYMSDDEIHIKDINSKDPKERARVATEILEWLAEYGREG